jgi:hypothetical protein
MERLSVALRCSGVYQDPRPSTVGPKGPTEQVKDGQNPPVQRGDGEVVWWLGAAARGDVLAREGGNGGEVPELRGGKGEVRAA